MSSMRTYGDKPQPFQLEENGDFYYIGSEVIIKELLLTLKEDCLFKI